MSESTVGHVAAKAPPGVSSRMFAWLPVPTPRDQIAYAWFETVLRRKVNGVTEYQRVEDMPRPPDLFGHDD